MLLADIGYIENVGDECILTSTCGNKEYYSNNKLHRLDGPAIELASGSKYWYYEGEQINCRSQEEFERILNLKVFW